LADPEQQQPALAGARNSSTTCSKATLTEILSVQPTPQKRRLPFTRTPKLRENPNKSR
jgi:hypothetical protein